MSTGHCFVVIPALLLAVLLVDAPSSVLAVGVVTGGTADDGYVVGAFEKLGRHWSPPPGLHGDFRVQVEVRIDERGGIAGCTTRQSSGMDAFDAAACGAVEQAGNLGVPPGGKPMTLYCTFQSQRERKRLPDPDEELQKDIRARMEAQNRFSTQRAGWAEEDARYKAEKAARAQGQTFEGYDFFQGRTFPGLKRYWSVLCACSQAPSIQQEALEEGGGLPQPVSWQSLRPVLQLDLLLPLPVADRPSRKARLILRLRPAGSLRRTGMKAPRRMRRCQREKRQGLLRSAR